MADVELDIDDDFRFFCPMTGQLIYTAEEISPSPATLFACSPGFGREAFDSAREDMKALWEQVWDASDRARAEGREPDDPYETFLARVQADHNVVVFAFSSEGMACGPLSSTSFLGIDFDHNASEGDAGDDDESDDDDDEDPERGGGA